jgi:hypothetical protein
MQIWINHLTKFLRHQFLTYLRDVIGMYFSEGSNFSQTLGSKLLHWGSNLLHRGSKLLHRGSKLLHRGSNIL